MNVLSLFDGMSCGRIALQRAGFQIDNYFASEIDKYAIKVSKANWLNIVHIGDVTTLDLSKLPHIDLVLAGSPCQGFSFAGKQLAFDDPRSKLYWRFSEVLKATKPKYFLLENVKMKKEYQNVITNDLGVEPIEINSALVSAQNRKRLYWTNISHITQPADKDILLKDILEHNSQDFIFMSKNGRQGDYIRCGVAGNLINESIAKNNKAHCLTARYGGAVAWNSCQKNQRTMIPFEESDEKDPNVYNGLRYRKLTPIECERLQTVPDNYTNHVSKTQRYKMLGNAWTVDVIAHILSHIWLT